MQPPLAGIKVLDLTRLLPGPYATMLLAEMGADVVKVEDPREQDFVRHVPPTWPLGARGAGGPSHERPTEGRSPTEAGTGPSALHLALNRNKRSIVLDLKSPAGRDAFLKLAETSDVVVEGFRPGVIDRLGIGWDALSRANPRLTLASLSGYGQTGPMAPRAGHDLTYIALAGVLGIGGPAAGPPAHPGVQVADLAGSLNVVAGVLGAILARERAGADGRGTRLDLSMYDAATGMLVFHLATLLAGGGMQREKAALTGGQPNYRVYRTKDARWIAVGSLEPKFWKRLCDAIGRPDLVAAPFAAMQDESARVVLVAQLEELFATKTLAEWIALTEGADAAVEPVLEGEEVLAHPHAEAREIAPRVTLPGIGAARVPRSPIRPWTAKPLPPPAPGEHTDAVLREAGLGADEIAKLRSSGVLG